MKRTLAVVLLLVCLASLCPGKVQAANDYDMAFQSALTFLDMYYDLDAEYMVTKMNDHFYDWEQGMLTDFAPMTVPAAEYEQALNLRFAVSDAMLKQIRTLAGYDAAAGTYVVSFMGGFGGNMPERVYCGYRAMAEGGFEVYYQHVTYAFLPANADIWADIEKDGYPDQVEYQGHIYEYGPDGYCYISSYDGYGNVYLVEYLSGRVRILSKSSFSGTFAPDVPKDVTYDVAEDAGIALIGGSFPANTVVTAGKAEGAALTAAEEAMKTLAQVYEVYEITAMLEEAAVQPTEAVKLTITIPDGYSKNLALYRLEENGQMTILETRTEVAGTLTVDLNHFSIYILADLDTKPQAEEEPSPSQPAEEPTEDPAPSQTEKPGTMEQSPDGNKKEVILYIGLGLIAALFVMAVVLILIKKRY